MIEIYQRDATGEVGKVIDCAIALTQKGLVWIDLDDPTEAEELQVEAALGVDVLTAFERRAYEDSARFYEENGALYLTVTLLARRDDGPFRADAVTFILTDAGTLVTVRQIHPRAFSIGQGRSLARITQARGGGDVLMALLDACVERIADLLQENTAAANAVSQEIFNERRNAAADVRATLRTLGRLGTLAALSHDSLSSLQRAATFAALHDATVYGLEPARLTALRRDTEQLERAIEAFQSHLTFLQEAMLGLVGAAQNNTLRALSLATIAFVPPTLIASIFGMNFTAMSWFQASWGPPAAFLLMLGAPAALFAIAKWRRWF
ncbi:MAG: CorA family divalent cation transporter [Hyphomonadaceae bacterium]|nr:CorA family divalent cation transporter [Hyphomonadaceae bacterium]